MSEESGYDKTTDPRPISEFQADLGQFLDSASRRQAVAVSVPYGTVYLRQEKGGQQGQDFDVLVANENDAFCWHELKDRTEVRRLVEGSTYHETRVARGPVGKIMPQRITGGGPVG